MDTSVQRRSARSFTVHFIFCATGAASARLLQSVGGGPHIGVSMLARARVGASARLTHKAQFWQILTIHLLAINVTPEEQETLLFPEVIQHF